MKLGKYRNKRGCELEVVKPILGGITGYLTLGGIYLAVTPADILGQQSYLVTSESMRDSGYELVEEAVEDA